MFDGALNVQLDGELLKIHYPNISVMREVEHTVSLFFNDVSKIPVVCHTLSSTKIATRLIPQIWGQYQVNTWDLD